MKKEKTKIKNKYTMLRLLLVILIFIILAFLISAFGRYVTNSVNNFFMRSKEFYFNSDKLKENTAVYQVDNWSGIDDYTIVVNMNSRKNNLQATTYDIGYNITYSCSDNAICELEKTSGTIPSDTNSDSFYLRITPNRQLEVGDKVEVEITASSTAQYKKTLKGKFTLVVGKERLSYEITDSVQSPYMQLRLTNTLTYYIVEQAFDSYTVGQKIDSDTYRALSDTNKAKCYSSIVTLSFDPTVVLIDTTNEIVENAITTTKTTINGKDYINSITIKIDAISSQDIRFYKLNIANDYTYPKGNNTSIVQITSE